MPGAPSSVLVTTSKALVTRSDALVPSSDVFLHYLLLFTSALHFAHQSAFNFTRGSSLLKKLLKDHSEAAPSL